MSCTRNASRNARRHFCLQGWQIRGRKIAIARTRKVGCISSALAGGQSCGARSEDAQYKIGRDAIGRTSDFAAEDANHSQKIKSIAHNEAL